MKLSIEADVNELKELQSMLNNYTNGISQLKAENEILTNKNEKLFRELHDLKAQLNSTRVSYDKLRTSIVKGEDK